MERTLESVTKKSAAVLTWEHGEPDHFPCHACNEIKATVQVEMLVKFNDAEAIIKPCLCKQCAASPARDIFNKIWK